MGDRGDVRNQPHPDTDGVKLKWIFTKQGAPAQGDGAGARRLLEKGEAKRIKSKSQRKRKAKEKKRKRNEKRKEKRNQMGGSSYLQEKLAELDTEIGGVRHRELVFRYLSIGIAVPQVTLGAVMTATALLESLVPPESARTIVGYLGIANLAVQALAAAMQCSSRAAACAARRRTLLVLRNDVQLAIAAGSNDTAHLAVRIARIYDDTEEAAQPVQGAAPPAPPAQAVDAVESVEAVEALEAVARSS